MFTEFSTEINDKLHFLPIRSSWYHIFVRSRETRRPSGRARTVDDSADSFGPCAKYQRE